MWASQLRRGDNIVKDGTIYTVKNAKLTHKGMVVLTLIEASGKRVIVTAPLPKMANLKEVEK